MFPVVKAAGYILAHTPGMVINNGSTTATERVVNPGSEFLKKIPNHIRSYEEAVNYLPNQIYIGNERPEILEGKELPYTEIKYDGKREGKFGEIVPEDEFMFLMAAVDVFDLVHLSEEFVSEVKPKIEKNYPELKAFTDKIKGENLEEVKGHLDEHHMETLEHDGKIVGIVKAAHDVDVNLSAHTMFENIVSKASGVLSGLALLRSSGIDPSEVEFVIECSEEACGDVNQRGGGNFAKAIAEVLNFENATGCDVRGFCAAPTHAILQAAGQVQSGIHKNVLVLAGGSTAKLGMNAKDHIEKGLPVIEDVVAGFAVLITENDGKSPIIRTDVVGKHTVKTGSAPQKVMSALTLDPLKAAGLKLTDIDSYSVEMQNPDITVPAKAGNVPEANFKMIGALAVMNKEIEKADIEKFIAEKGIPGWAPTQGHIPSGVPYLGFMIEDLTTGKKNRAMFVGKGSLFLGRMTNLFDGISYVCERNSGQGSEQEGGMDKEEIRKVVAEYFRKIAADMLAEEK